MTRAPVIALLLVLLVGALGFDATALAHHSYAATYISNKTVEIRGEIVAFMYRNPHSVLQVLVREADGTSTRWGCEWEGTLKLSTSYVERFTLKPGDQVIITGAPGRDPETHHLLVKTIQRPADGWKWPLNQK